jgi:hypothetical protein
VAEVYNHRSTNQLLFIGLILRPFIEELLAFDYGDPNSRIDMWVMSGPFLKWEYLKHERMWSKLINLKKMVTKVLRTASLLWDYSYPMFEPQMVGHWGSLIC